MRQTAPRSTSFRVQLALVFGTIVVALAALLSLVLGRMMSQTITQEAGRSLQVVAGNAALMLADGMQDRLMLVQNLANSSTLWERGIASSDVVNSLTRQQAIRPHLAWIGVTDPAGRVQAATGGLLVGVDVSARPWFSAGLAGPHVGDLHAAKLLAGLLPAARDGEPQRFVDFAAPVRRDGKTIGVLAIHGSWDWAYSVIDALMPTGAESRALEVFIFDRRGEMIFSPADRFDPTPTRAQRLPTTALATDGAVIRWADGTEYLTASAPVTPRNEQANLGWTVVARLPADTALADARHAVRDALGIGLAAALLASLIAWIVAGSVSGPLSAIARAARAVQEGRTGASMPRVGRNRELADLSDALASMTTRLLAANEELELRVTERTAALAAANTELAKIARFDALTELYNRRGFEEQLKLAMAAARRRGAPLSVLMVDADHFKRVNDTHGHAAGDRVLKTLADVMRRRLRDSDVLGRVGGEEFVALLPDTDLVSARRVADDLVRLVAATAMPIVGTVTISCGVTTLNDGDEGSAALTRADAALYRAKSRGRNRAAFQDTSLEDLGIG